MALNHVTSESFNLKIFWVLTMPNVSFWFKAKQQPRDKIKELCNNSCMAYTHKNTNSIFVKNYSWYIVCCSLILQVDCFCKRHFASNCCQPEIRHQTSPKIKIRVYLWRCKAQKTWTWKVGKNESGPLFATDFWSEDTEGVKTETKSNYFRTIVVLCRA